MKKVADNTLSIKFIFEYILVNIKRKKVKSYLFIFSLFISMFVVGFSFVLTNDVSNLVVDSFNSLTDDNQIIMKNKNEIEDKIEEISIDELGAMEIINNSNYFMDYGYIYSSNFEEQFCDNNYMEILGGGLVFYDVGIRDISEVIDLDDIDVSYKFYPYKPLVLEKDELVLGLKKSDVRKICNSLNLNNTDEKSLSQYMEFNDLYANFCFSNLNWNYNIDIKIKIKAFFISPLNDVLLAHNDKDFVSYIFEDVMKLPTSNNLSITDLYPWTIKKQIYLKTDVLNIDNAINEYLKSNYYEKYDFKILKGNIHSDILSSSFHKGKFLISYASSNKVSYESIKEFIYENNIKNVFPLGTYYEAIESALVSGFTNTIFFSTNKDDLLEISYYLNDIDSNADTLDISSFDFGNVSYGNLITSALKKGVKIASSYNEIINGRIPYTIDEIMISSSMCKRYFSNYSEALNKKIYFIINNYNYYDGNTFSLSYLNISGVFEDDDERIYQDPYWYPTFLSSRLDYPLESIQINKFLVTVDDDFDYDTGNERLIFINPMIEVNESVNSMIKMINIILSIFSILLIISSFGIAQISIQTSMKEASKEVALFKCIGVNKKSIILLYLTYNLSYFLIGYLLSFLTLYFVSKLISCLYFNIPFSFLINIGPFIIMFLVGFIIVLPICLIYTLIPVIKNSNDLLKRYY